MVGLGEVGFQVVQRLLALRRQVVVIERVEVRVACSIEIVDMGVPGHARDGRNAKTLEQAEVGHSSVGHPMPPAMTLTNLDAGLTAKDLGIPARRSCSGCSMSPWRWQDRRRASR